MEFLLAILVGWWFFDDVVAPKLKKISELEERIAALEDKLAQYESK